MTTDDQIRDAINAQHDRIESALSAALGDPDLGAYPGDPDGAPDLESLIAMVAGLRRQRDEARSIGYALAADLQSAAERIDIDQEVVTRLEGERDAALSAGIAMLDGADKMREQWAEIEARLEAEKAALLSAQERDADLVRRAVMAIRHSDRKPRRPLWAHVCDAFAIGSTRAHELCIRFGRYPDVML